MGFLGSLTGDILDFLRAHVQPYGYLLLFLLTFLETSAFLGLLAPGEAAVVISGLFASRGPLQLGLVVPLAVVGAFLGDTTGYWIGRRFGTRLLERYGKYAFFDGHALAGVRTYYQRHGGKTVLLGRFTSIIRSFGPFVAGSSRMPYGRFALWSALGCAVWGTLYSLIGYFFGESWDLIERYLGRVGLIGFLCGAAALAIYLLVRKRPGPRGDGDDSTLEVDQTAGQPDLTVVGPGLPGETQDPRRARRRGRSARREMRRTRAEESRPEGAAPAADRPGSGPG